jgi:Mn-dependent DtxR family transcriptional regulator
MIEHMIGRITGPEIAIITYLYGKTDRESYTSEIADDLGRAASWASNYLGQLKEKGIVSSEPYRNLGTAGGTVKPYVLTEFGEALALGFIHPEKLALIYRLAKELEENMHEVVDEPPDDLKKKITQTMTRYIHAIIDL